MLFKQLHRPNNNNNNNNNTEKTPTEPIIVFAEARYLSSERLGILQQETRALRNDTKRLEGDAEVERIAREQYGLVRPGETPYVLVPSTTPPAK